MYELQITENTRKEIEQLKASGEESEIRRLEELLKELQAHPRTGIGKPEELGGALSGKWSRRISEKNRLVYEIDTSAWRVTVLRAIGHYTDH